MAALLSYKCLRNKCLSRLVRVTIKDYVKFSDKFLLANYKSKMKARSRHYEPNDFEPIFNGNKIYGCSNVELNEWLLDIDNNITMCANDIVECKNYFKADRPAQALFKLASDWGLPTDSKFLAIELLDAFMTQHIKDVHKRIVESSSADKDSDWLGVLHRIEKQLLLRICTCCQIASKLHSNYHIVTMNHIQSVLNSHECHYSKNGIIQSELRVLKTLNFRVLFNTPYTCVIVLLQLISNSTLPLNLQQCHLLCSKMLEMTYLHRQHVFDKLYFITTGQQLEQLINSEDRFKFCAVENDSLLIACGVVMATCHLIDRHLSKSVITILSGSTRVTREDIVDMGTALLQLIIEMCQ